MNFSSSDVAADRPVSDFADTEGEEYLQEALRFLSKESNRRSDGLRPSKPQEPRDPMPLLDVAHVMIARWLGLKPSHRMETKWVRSGSRCSCGARHELPAWHENHLWLLHLLSASDRHSTSISPWMACIVMRLSVTAETLLHTALIAAGAQHHIFHSGPSPSTTNWPRPPPLNPTPAPPPRQYENPLKGADASLLAASTKVSVDGHEHLLMCVVVREPATSDRAVSSLPGLTLHWSTASKPGDRWRAPPRGWNTFPYDSKDAGVGSWPGSCVLLVRACCYCVQRSAVHGSVLLGAAAGMCLCSCACAL